MRFVLVALCALFSITAYCQETTLADTLLTWRPTNLINWKVGDTAEYEVSVGGMGKLGGMVKSVTSIDESKNALWVKQDTDLMGQKDVSEMLMSRSDGKILKYVHNGKEEQLPDESIEIVKTENAEVDVPAGHFKSLHIVANTKQVKGVEVWMNQRDTVMDGMLKQTMPVQFGTVEVALAKFRRAGLHALPMPQHPCKTDYDNPDDECDCGITGCAR